LLPPSIKAIGLKMVAQQKNTGHEVACSREQQKEFGTD
jgi:hypothetical protein